MRQFYPHSKIVATTTGSENAFRAMRNAYQMNSPVSLQKFLLRHTLLLEGSTKIGRRVLKSDGYVDVDLDPHDAIVEIVEIVKELNTTESFGNVNHSDTSVIYHQNEEKINSEFPDKNLLQDKESFNCKNKINSRNGKKSDEFSRSSHKDTCKRQNNFELSEDSFIFESANSENSANSDVEEKLDEFTCSWKVNTAEDENLPKITSVMKKTIVTALELPDNVIVIEKLGVPILKGRDLRTLDDFNWLNDEVINFYMRLIEVRGVEEEDYLNVRAMNSFFYVKLARDGYQSVKRWTKDVDIFTFDIVLIPIHLDAHWCMVTIDFQNKFVNYYDSLGSDNQRCLRILRQYLLDEHLEKKNLPLDLSDWVFECDKNIPQQTNDSDCGVFACTFAKFAAASKSFIFTQKDMRHIRNLMIYEICTAKLL